VAPTDSELKDALALYETARSEFESSTKAITQQLTDNRLPTDAEIRLEEEARAKVVTARRRVLLAFAIRKHNGPT
jgi:hypothetical protein